MSKKPEVISRGSFNCHIVRLSGGSIRLEARFTVGNHYPAWLRVYPPHAITEARMAARYFCEGGHLPTYAEFCRLRSIGAIRPIPA